MFAENAIDNDVRFCASSRLLQSLLVTGGRVICATPVEYSLYILIILLVSFLKLTIFKITTGVIFILGSCFRLDEIILLHREKNTK